MYRLSSNQYEDQDEEPLVEEFDPNFEPDEEEVKMYAVQALGMDLPQDNRFLYLAKQALKKPLPDTWGAYQRSDGEVYYKHKVTQQKTTEHPIDVQYRRLFQQEKDKAARRTLKSKANKPAGVVAMKLLGNIAREEQIGNQNLLSNISGVSEQSNIDLQRQLQSELSKYERSLQKDFEEFKSKQQRQQIERERRMKQSHQEQLDRITRNSMMPISFDQRLKQQKNSIRKQIQQEKEETFKRNLKEEQERIKRQVLRNERDLENQWQLKLKEIQQRNVQKLETKGQQIENIAQDIQKQKQEKQKKRKFDIERARNQFERNKAQFENEANKQLDLQVQNISKETSQKLKVKKGQFQSEYIKLRKLLKSSPEDRIKELVEKKTRLQQISNKKFQVYRAKELQLIEKDSKINFEKERAKLSQLCEAQYRKQEEQFNKKEEEKLKKYIDQLNQQYQEKITVKEKEIFEKFKEKLNSFQLTKNKSLISARQKFISEIQGKKSELQKNNALNSIRLQIRQKQFDITNHQKLIKGIRAEIKLTERKLKKYELDRKLYRLKDEQEITDALKNQIGILKQKDFTSNKKDPLPSVFKQHQLKLQQLKKSLNYDQNILGKVLKHLQSTSLLPFYERKKIINSDLPTDIQSQKLSAIGAGKNELIKKYNTDVRNLRENQKMINQYEQILKKAEYDEESSLAQLRLFQVDYKVPQLRAQIESQGFDNGVFKLKQYMEKNPMQDYAVNPDLVTTKRVQDIFQDHSRFLMNIKQQLNSKLWQIRGMGYYSRRF